MANLRGGTTVNGLPILGKAGTDSYIAKLSKDNTLVNSLLYENATGVGIGNTNPTEKLEVTGNIKATSFVGNLTGNAATSTTATNVAWNGITSKPTTLSGYGITDAASSSHTHNNATQSSAGFMSSADKTKLDGLTGGLDTTTGDARYLKLAGGTMTGNFNAFGQNNYISVGTATNPSTTAGTIGFVSNGTSGSGGAYIEYFPPASGNGQTTNQLNITGAGAGNLTNLNLNADSTNFNGKISLRKGSAGPRSITAYATNLYYNSNEPAVINEDQRPGLHINGPYPEISLVTGTSNTQHGSALRFISYNDDNANTWKHWVIGSPGRNSTYMDFGYAENENNPHAGIGEWGGNTGTGRSVLRIDNSKNIIAIGGGDFVVRDNAAVGLRNYGATAWIRPQDGNGNMHLRNYSGNIYHTTITHYFQHRDGGSYGFWDSSGLQVDSGWFRVKGQNGFYFQDYQGGWYMTDTTWIRAYNGKNIFTTGSMQADSNINANNNVTWGAAGSRTNGFTSHNDWLASGFYESSVSNNSPDGSGGWWHLLSVRHTNAANHYAMQFSSSFYNNNLYFRATNGGAPAWKRVMVEDTVCKIGNSGRLVLPVGTNLWA